MEGLDRSPEGMDRARNDLGLPTGRRILVAFGGSLGARRINDAVLALVGRWQDRADLAVLHVTGRRDWDRVAEIAPDVERCGALFYRRVPYESRMSLLYRAADLVVCRAGAMTVAELAVAGVPAVLVPLPGAPGDHQTANARPLVEAGGALLLDDDACGGRQLGTVAGELLADAERLRAMGEAAVSMGRPGAALRVAALVEDCADGKARV